ncbi:MAG: response regulator [Acidimicrobiales bacterium]
MTPRVLVADDDQALRSTVGEMLRGAGYDVAEASDGQVALDELARQDAEVLVLDVRMPRKDGISVLNELDPAPPPPQVVLVSAYDIDRDVRARLAPRIFRVLRKPVVPRTLLDAVSDAARSAHPADRDDEDLKP